MLMITDTNAAHGAEEPFETDSQSVEYVRPSLGRWLARGASFALLGAVFFPSTALLATSFLGALSVLAMSASLPRKGVAALSVSPKGVWIRRGQRSRFIEKEKITDGLVIPSLPKRTVVFHLRNGDRLSALVDTEGDALHALNALGISADRRRAVVVLGGVSPHLVAGVWGVIFILYACMLTAVGFYTRSFFMTAAAALTMLVWTLWAISQPTELVIGTDGVLIRNPQWDHFVPYDLIERVSSPRSRLILHLRSTPERMLNRKEVSITSNDQCLINGLADRIREAMQCGAAHAARGAAASLAYAELLNPLLNPYGRPFDEWRKELSALGCEQDEYRSYSLPTAALIAILENPEESAGFRIGAAILLRSSGRPEARERIRVAAEVCARERIRVALDLAAKDELQKVHLGSALVEWGMPPSWLLPLPPYDDTAEP